MHAEVHARISSFGESERYLILHTYHIILTYSCITEYLDCFYVWLLCIVVLWICVCKYLFNILLSFLWLNAKYQIVGSQRWVSSFLRFFHAVLYRSCTTLQPHQQHDRVPNPLHFHQVSFYVWIFIVSFLLFSSVKYQS